MERLRGSIDGPVAIVLCCILCFPAPPGLAQQVTTAADQAPPKTRHMPEHTPGQIESGQMGRDERILHALNRFTFGPRPSDLEAVRAMGLEKWFDEQLYPANIDEADLNARLAQYRAMQWSTQDLVFRMPSPAIIRQAANGKIEIPPNGTLHAVYENQIYRFQVRKAAQAEKQTNVAANGGGASTGGASSPGQIQGMSTNANMDADGSANMAVGNANMEASGGTMAPNAAGAAKPAETQPDAVQPAMAQPAVKPDRNLPDRNSMAPTANGQESDQPRVDERRIASILALAPEQRVRRLQSMRPEEFESFIKSLRPAQRQALATGMTPDLRESLEDLEHPEQTVVQELFAQRLARDIYSNAQLEEVMTDFWFNHFNVYLRKNEQMPYYLVSYERDVIRPHALGKFEDLLEAVAHSPAMMIYLDNAESMGPDSLAAERAKMVEARRPNAKRQAPEGLNENYARELMELHTLGVNGGYTQADVIQVARVLTGWTVDRPQMGGGFQFNPNRHEPGTKKVMGTKIKEKGEMEGRELLHMLATRPATAEFLSRKLAIRFVSDDPPQALVDRMAKSYLASSGDIATVLKTLFHSPEFWAASDYRAKVKTPLEFVVSAARASNANVENFQPLVNALRQMGMPLYGCIPPVGYKWDEADWVSTGALVDRMNFALSLAANRLPGITVEWAPELDLSALDSDAPAKQGVPTPESEEARLEPLLVAGGVSATTREAALKQFQAQSGQGSVTATPVMERSSQVSSAAAERPGAPAARRANRAPTADVYEREDQLLAGLLLGSPEFQRR